MSFQDGIHIRARERRQRAAERQRERDALDGIANATHANELRDSVRDETAELMKTVAKETGVAQSKIEPLGIAVIKKLPSRAPGGNGIYVSLQGNPPPWERPTEYAPFLILQVDDLVLGAKLTSVSADALVFHFGHSSHQSKGVAIPQVDRSDYAKLLDRAVFGVRRGARGARIVADTFGYYALEQHVERFSHFRHLSISPRSIERRLKRGQLARGVGYSEAFTHLDFDQSGLVLPTPE